MDDTTTQKKTITCLDCETVIELSDDIEVGDVVVCEECGTELEIISIDPLEVDYLMIEK